MSTPKFTPGPWRWMNNTSLVGDYGRRHAILIGQNLRQRDESGRLVEFDPLSPDGRLMEAAPDLYRALDFFNDLFPCGHEQPESACVGCGAKAALAKAVPVET